jgi:RHH-type proline utilization regulon transcriptional repressor/proline dehydrogenase/delta 1-pyrroline-5-carboxylate dehydrogenase
LLGAAASYEKAMAEEFARDHDDFHLIGQDNLRRYLPIDSLRIRVHPEDSVFDLLARTIAARVAGCAVTLSSPSIGLELPIELLREQTESWPARIEVVEESDEELAQAIRAGQIERLRYADPSRVPDIVWRAAAEAGLHLATAPVLASGRIELLHYLREQSVCIDYHRYGNLGARAEEVRPSIDRDP